MLSHPLSLVSSWLVYLLVPFLVTTLNQSSSANISGSKSPDLWGHFVPAEVSPRYVLKNSTLTSFWLYCYSKWQSDLLLQVIMLLAFCSYEVFYGCDTNTSSAFNLSTGPNEMTFNRELWLEMLICVTDAKHCTQQELRMEFSDVGYTFNKIFLSDYKHMKHWTFVESVAILSASVTGAEICAVGNIFIWLSWCSDVVLQFLFSNHMLWDFFRSVFSATKRRQD